MPTPDSVEPRSDEEAASMCGFAFTTSEIELSEIELAIGSWQVLSVVVPTVDSVAILDQYPTGKAASFIIDRSIGR